MCCLVHKDKAIAAALVWIHRPVSVIAVLVAKSATLAKYVPMVLAKQVVLRVR